MKKIAVIGAGSWGTALSQVLVDKGNEVLIYDISEEVVKIINEKNESKYFDCKINEKIKATTNLKEVISFAEYILLAVPSKAMRKILFEINKLLTEKIIFINASKGIEPKTYKRISEILDEEIDSKYQKSFVFLTGPSHAEEVILRKLTTVVSVSTDLDAAIEIQNLFNNNSYFRVYHATDLITSELCASIKNVIALASGIIYGLGYGDNTRAALITRGLVEMKKLILELGGLEETLYGLTGVGDLIVTATSMHSRNFQAGNKIGKGENLKDIIDSTKMVVEGVRSCDATYHLAKKLNIEMPLVNAVYDVLFNLKSPDEMLLRLMNRDLKSE